MKSQIIQLEPYDDVVSVRDRLAATNAERVLLVWPRQGYILKRKLDLVLIQREAARQGARLALVTTQPDVLNNADDLNISTFDSVKDSQSIAWKHPRSKVFVDRSDRPDNALDAYELRLAASRLNRRTPGQRRISRVIRIGTVLILALALIAVTVIVAPSAEVTLSPAQGQINTTVTLTADPSITKINVESGHIPAAIADIQVDTQASIPTTGSSDVPNTLASGIVVFTNETKLPVFVPGGTVVSTAGLTPARFHTTADITVPAGLGQTTEVTVEATQDSGGPAGNVEPNMIINIDGDINKQITVQNPDPTRGGTIRQQGIVTKDDYNNLLILAREKIRQQALGGFSPGLTGTQFIAPDSIKIVEERPEWTSYSAFIGDPADTLTLNMRARVQALVIDEQLARQAAFANLSAKIPAGRQAIPASLIFTRGGIHPIDANGQVSFLMSASANVAAAIDPEIVRNQITGASVNDAANILQRYWLLDPQRPPHIDVYPAILGHLPILPLRIDVHVVQ